MLDFGMAELLVIMALGVLVIGPKELPVLMRGLGNIMRRISYIKYAFTSQFDEFMRDQDLDDMRNAVNFESKRYSAHHGEDFDEAAEDEDVMLPLSDHSDEANVEDVDNSLPQAELKDE